ncbi:MAG: transporter substrate-binding protein [Gammaproteobacteria bacterium]|nr:transporter substrate-binding protein [Gammaproteobacteria bacterium]
MKKENTPDQTDTNNVVEDALDENADLTFTRRTFLKGSVAVSAGIAAPAYLAGISKSFAAASGPVKIGHIEDLSGNLAVYGVQKDHAAQLAVKEINKGKTLKGGPAGSGGVGSLSNYAVNPPVMGNGDKDLKFVNDGGDLSGSGMAFVEDEDVLIDSGESGILGREVELLHPDGQSSNNIWQQLTRKLIQEDKVDCLVAGFTSAEREAIRPIVDQFKQLYIYTNQYEGGVADSNTFCTGAICEQQVIPVVDYMIQRFGPRVYTIAADYNFGQLTAAWTRAFAPVVGGEIIGEEFVPLSVSDFTTSIAKIQAAKPDWVFTLLVGSNQSNYYPQAAATGLEYPMASTVNMAQGYEHRRFKAPSLDRMYNCVNYIEEIPTNRNRAFVKRWYEMFPDDPYIGQMAQNTYFSIHMYAKAVRIAGTTDQEEVKRAFESGLHLEAPEGTVFMEPSTHHCSHYIRLATADADHNVSFVREWPSIQPWWLQRLGVNLVRHKEYKQYIPDEDPFFKG